MSDTGRVSHESISQASSGDSTGEGPASKFMGLLASGHSLSAVGCPLLTVGQRAARFLASWAFFNDNSQHASWHLQLGRGFASKEVIILHNVTMEMTSHHLCDISLARNHTFPPPLKRSDYTRAKYRRQDPWWPYSSWLP